MTRPSDVKPREGDRPGTTWDQYILGDELPEVRFKIAPDIMREYAVAVEGDPKGYPVDGRMAAIPSVLAVYLMSVLYRKYPPLQGGIMAGNKFSFFNPIWADEEIEIVGRGKIEEKFEKKGRKYIRYSAHFTRTDGTPIATAVNTSTFPQ
ncbi:MAG TPA: hypothetical protein VL402_02000 [Xanthobacteraceae bacterium]|nr:hypothetical protein [Xanthobacteraceae bacterium]